MEGNSGRAVGRILGIGKNMCLYWIRKYAKNIEPKKLQIRGLTSSKWTSCTASSREKNRFYTITLVSRDTREIVGFDIAFDKSRERIQRLLVAPRRRVNTTLTLIRRIRKCAMKVFTLR